MTPEMRLQLGLQAAATIPELLRRAARLYGTAPALAAEGRASTSYEGLYQFIRECRYRLFRAGVEAGARLALAVPPGPEATALNLLATCTGVAIPMNPWLPREAAIDQLRRVRPDMLIADAESLPVYRDAARELGLPLIVITRKANLSAGQFLIEGEEAIPAAKDRAVSPPFLPFSTAAVFQTADVSGAAKCVPQTHANLLAAAVSIEQTMELVDGDRFLNVSSHFRVGGLALVLAALKAGNVIYCAPGFLRAQFLDCAQAFQPTWFWATPAMLKELVPLAQVRGARPCGDALRAIRVGSSAFSNEWVERVEAVFGAPAATQYGMTEAAQIAAMPLSQTRTKPGSVGRAAGAEILILNSDGEPAAPFNEGEVLVRGSSVAAGYEESTAADKPEPFWTGRGSRWFRTGDMGRMDADGFLFLSGCRRDMINRGGEKVWPREVEDVLERHPSVEQAVAFAVPHRTLGDEVGAAVVLRAGEDVSEADLRSFVLERLANYQAPARIAFLPAIRVGPGEKPVRARLAAELGMSVIEAEDTPEAFYTGPGTALERELAAIWREVLQAPRIGLDDDFFALGGDAATIAALSAELQNRFGIMRRMLDRADFFTHPTIRAQALMIEQARRARAEWKTEIAAASETFPAFIIPLNARPRRRDDAPPLFLAPMAGSAPGYMEGFASHLMAQQRCFGLDTRSITNCPSIEELAAVLVASLERTCTQGPFYLGGHCFGGVVAFEMAQQLAAKGRRPETLFLFDVPMPGLPEPQRDWRLFAQAVGKRATGLSRLGEFAGGAWLPKKTQASRTGVAQLDALEDAAIQLLQRYQAKPYEGMSVNFLAREHEQTGSPLDRRLGWSTVIQPSPEVVHVDGSESGLFSEPAAVELAAVCRQHLPKREMESVLAMAATANQTNNDELPRVGVPA